MKTLSLFGFILLATMIVACSTSQKNALPANPSAKNQETIAVPLVAAKPANGIYAPGNEELTAIQTQYKETTLEQLQEGHQLYTNGACVNCHGAKGIYQYDALAWKDIVTEMAKKARITAAQKDAVYKYVLAIKAVQPK